MVCNILFYYYILLVRPAVWQHQQQNYITVYMPHENLVRVKVMDAVGEGGVKSDTECSKFWLHPQKN